MSETRRQPLPSGTVTYIETFEWALGRRFMRGETSGKSDDTTGMFLATYDVSLKAYRFWMFDSRLFAVELPAPRWDGESQTMEWRSNLFNPVSFNARTSFPDRDTMTWNATLKDWKGTVIYDVAGTGIRRK